MAEPEQNFQQASVKPPQTPDERRCQLFKKIDPSRSHSSFAANVAIIWP
jgi:hypothetical protein